MRIARLLFPLFLLPVSAFGQGIRIDSNVTTTASNVPPGASAAVMTLPNAIVTVCSFPAVPAFGSPCTNTVPTFSDVALTVPINNPMTADQKGRYGFWVSPGLLTYSVQTQAGTYVGTFALSLDSPPGPVGPPGGSLSYPGVTTDGAGGLSKAMTVFNVKGFGATGNGITDDSAAINAAIVAIDNVGGGVLYFPLGNYFSANCGFILGSPTIVRGDGASTRDSTSISINKTGVAFADPGNTLGSTVICGSPTATLFTVTGKSGKFENISLLNTSATTPTAGAAIFTNSTYHSQRIDYDNIWVWGFFDGVHVGVGNSWVMTNSQIYNTVRRGLWIQNTVLPDAGDWAVSGNVFSSGPRTTVGSAGVYQDSSGGGKLIDNKFNTVGGGFFDHGIWLNLAGSVQGQYSLNNIETTIAEPIYIQQAWPWLTFTDNMLIAPTGFADITAVNGLNNAYIGGGTMNGLGTTPYAVNLQGTLITVTVMPFSSNNWTVAPTNMVTSPPGPLSEGDINNTLLNADAFNGNSVTSSTGTFTNGVTVGATATGGAVSWAGKTPGANWNCTTVGGLGLQCVSSNGAEFDLFDNSMVNSGHGPYAIGGIPGFTGTKTTSPTATCVFTIEGGLVMNITGC